MQQEKAWQEERRKIDEERLARHSRSKEDQGSKEVWVLSPVLAMLFD